MITIVIAGDSRVHGLGKDQTLCGVSLYGVGWYPGADGVEVTCEACLNGLTKTASMLSKVTEITDDPGDGYVSQY